MFEHSTHDSGRRESDCSNGVVPAEVVNCCCVVVVVIVRGLDTSESTAQRANVAGCKNSRAPSLSSTRRAEASVASKAPYGASARRPRRRTRGHHRPKSPSRSCRRSWRRSGGSSKERTDLEGWISRAAIGRMTACSSEGRRVVSSGRSCERLLLAALQGPQGATTVAMKPVLRDPSRRAGPTRVAQHRLHPVN